MLAANLACDYPALRTNSRCRREAERVLAQRTTAIRIGRVGADRVKPLECHLGGNLRVLGDQRLIGGVRIADLVSESLGIVEYDAVTGVAEVAAVVAEPLGPEVDRLRPLQPPDDAVNHPLASTSAGNTGVLEEGEVSAGIARLVAVEQVVDRSVVLVNRLLHQAQAKYADVEVDVLLRVGGDRSDVVDALEF